MYVRVPKRVPSFCLGRGGWSRQEHEWTKEGKEGKEGDSLVITSLAPQRR